MRRPRTGSRVIAGRVPAERTSPRNVVTPPHLGLIDLAIRSFTKRVKVRKQCKEGFTISCRPCISPPDHPLCWNPLPVREPVLTGAGAARRLSGSGRTQRGARVADGLRPAFREQLFSVITPQGGSHNII